MERLTGLYEAYFEQVRAAQKRLKPAEGLFGMGGGLASAPCHDAFIEALKAFLDSAEVREDPGQVRQILDYIYRAPLAYPDVHPSAYWMLLAAHGLTLQAAGALLPKDAQALYLWYQKAYPRRARLPVQNQVLAALKRQGI